jgi:GNAT superfamily N-acetyltransferase
MSAEDARRRFDDATRTHLYVALPHGVEVAPCSPEEWKQLSDAWWAVEPRPRIDVATLRSEAERAGVADLDAALGAQPGRLEHRVVLRAAGEPIGIYQGEQQDSGRYYMASTILRPEWRGRGVYRALLAQIEAAVRASGFLEMSSRHRADNNAVIIPKLRAGWVIAAFDVEPRYGLLVHLRRYLHDGLGRAFGYRIDGRHADVLRAAGAKVP